MKKYVRVETEEGKELIITIDPEQDLRSEDGEWGVWETNCKICGKEMVLVATVHSVTFGYAEMTPKNSYCKDHYHARSE